MQCKQLKLVAFELVQIYRLLENIGLYFLLIILLSSFLPFFPFFIFMCSFTPFLKVVVLHYGIFAVGLYLPPGDWLAVGHSLFNATAHSTIIASLINKRLKEEQ
jgi:hypothetical protein